MTRVLLGTHMPEAVLSHHQRHADLCLHWGQQRYNALVNLSALIPLVREKLPPVLLDLLDIAIGVYLADIAVLRGRNEAWTRTYDMLIPARNRTFWQHNRARLTAMLHALTRDNFRLDFCSHQPQLELLEPGGDGEQAFGAEEAAQQIDCASALSGGLDSLAGAVMLMRTDRSPLFVMHQSGNPDVRASQSTVMDTLESFRPGRGVFTGLLVQPRSAPNARFAFPASREREPSRRSRSLLFMTLLITGAYIAGVQEAYLCENGILSVALPLSSGRIGGLSTRSTHPAVLADFNSLLQAADIPVTLVNPFIYQTKAELIRDILRPVLTPDQIRSTISCWMVGRRNRQCGGCVPCLLRRLSLLAAGLPDEAYETDPLACPDDYRGTDAYGNVMDLLSQAVYMRSATDAQLLMHWPQLLDLPTVGVSIEDALATYRRFADEVWETVHQHFPESARLMETS